MYPFEIICFFCLVVLSTCKEFYFLKIECYKLSATPTAGEKRSLESAVKFCIKGSLCIGLREVSENKFAALGYPLLNATQEDWSNDYILDRSNGTLLKGAPTALDSKLIFGIYFSGSQTNCPYLMKEVNGRCEGTNAGGEEWCNSFPVYMNGTFDPPTGKCSVVPLQALVKEWQ